MIVFIGDWVKVNKHWSQVVDVGLNDTIQVVKINEYDAPVWVTKQVTEVERVLSNNEFQTILEEAV